jgi:TetR/AcrR family fatty acid metabolism transcriptional regulator
VRTKTAEQADKILNVAVRLFATHRFHEARMEDIAAAAGVGKGTLYRYFKDKEELYLALLERTSTQMEERLNAAVAQPNDPTGKLEAIVAAILDYCDEQPHVFDLIQHAEALHRPTQRFPWKARSLSIELTQEAILEGQQAGLFRVQDPQLAVLMLLGAIRAVYRFGDKPRPTNLAHQIVAGFLHGIMATEHACPGPSTKRHGSKVSVN